jgi:iron complex transport system ATP-binding protein
LRSAAGLVAHTGTIYVDGSPLHLRSGKRRAAMVAHIPQSPHMPESMPVMEYVVLGRNPYVPYFGQETRQDRAIADDVVRRLDLGEFANRQPNWTEESWHLGTEWWSISFRLLRFR